LQPDATQQEKPHLGKLKLHESPQAINSDIAENGQHIVACTAQVFLGCH